MLGLVNNNLCVVRISFEDVRLDNYFILLDYRFSVFFIKNHQSLNTDHLSSETS